MKYQKRIVACPVAIVVGALLALASPAQASGNGSKAPPKTDQTAHARKASPAGTQECDGYFNPAPQYSSSNRTLHYGGKILCNFSASYLHFAVNLYTVTGSGDNIEYHFQEQLVKNGAGTSLGGTTWTYCNGSNSSRWIASFYGQSSIGNLQPYPAWSAVYTYPCGGD